MPAVDIEIRCPTDEWHSVDPVSLVHRLERRIQHLDATLTEVRDDHAGATQEAEKARTRIGSPFEHESELHRLQRRQQEINEVLVPATNEVQVEPVAATSPRSGWQRDLPQWGLGPDPVPCRYDGGSDQPPIADRSRIWPRSKH